MGTLTKDAMATHLADEFGFNKREAKEIVQSIFEQMAQTLQKGEHLRISGFGNFILRDKSARPGRNPRTGEPVEVTARRVVTFKPGHKLRAMLEDNK